MSYEVPKTQKAAVKVGSGPSSTVEIKDIPVPELQPGQILVKVGKMFQKKTLVIVFEDCKN